MLKRVDRSPRGRTAALLLLSALLVPLSACAAPAPDPPEPAAVRLAVPDGGCPAAVGAARDVVAGGSDPTTLLRDPSRVVGAVVCEYSSALGPGRTRGRLHREVVLLQHDARRLAEAVHAVRIVWSSGSAACPADRVTADVLAFQRPGRTPDSDLWWWTSGCQSLDDGTVRTQQVANPSFGDFQQTFAQVVRAGH